MTRHDSSSDRPPRAHPSRGETEAPPAGAAGVLFLEAMAAADRLREMQDPSAVATVGRGDALPAGAVRDCHGQVLRSTAASLLAVFAAPGDAVDAAVRIQKETRERNLSLPQEERVEMRAALHLGAVDAASSGSGGEAGDLAARVAARAGPAQILATRSLLNALPPQAKYPSAPAGEVRPADGGEAEEIFEILWTDTATYQSLRSQLSTAVEQGILEAPRADPGEPAGSGAPQEHPDRIGNYRIKQVLGTGGMGIVYLAEQERPVRREVALKLVQSGIDSREFLARFDAERQALALLSHPNIAKVLDAGTTESGRPYFVMEFVGGFSLVRYCDRHRLGIRHRLEILLTVCEALRHAHGRGIVHRDIKPSNILVSRIDDRAVPRLIDFGLAKATQRKLTDMTLMTQYGQVVGTPEYMSPEQAGTDGSGVDGRTDVYSMGVTLYELLCGVRPFDASRLRRAGLTEALQVIREEDPVRPSQRLLGLGEHAEPVARARGTDVQGLVREIRGDLDWIVMKAMEKDRERRYPSIGEMASDIRRYLEHQPVLAGPPSMTYKLRKLVRRRPVHTLLALVLAVAIPAGALLGYRTIRQGAELRESELVTLRSRLVQAGKDPGSLLEVAGEILRLDPDDPSALHGQASAHFNLALAVPQGSEARRREVELALEAARRIERVRPDLRWPLDLQALILDRFGRESEAAALRRRAGALTPDAEAGFYQARFISTDPEARREDLERAESLLTDVLARAEQGSALGLRGSIRSRLGDDEGAAEDFRLYARTSPGNHYPHQELGLIRTRQGRFEEAEQRLQRAASLAPEEVLWNIHRIRSHNFTQWSRRLVGEGEREGALEKAMLASEAAAQSLQLDPRQPGSHVNLGSSLVDRYRLMEDPDPSLIDEAVRSFERALALAGEVDDPEERAKAVTAVGSLCDALLQAGMLEEAVPRCERAAELMPDVDVVFYNLAGAYALTGQSDRAFAALERDFELGDREAGYLRQDPWFESLHDDPRFQDLLERMETDPTGR